jgi:hypothetical protein
MIVSSTGTGSGGFVSAATTFMKPVKTMGSSPVMVGASAMWATTRAPERRRSSATPPMWSGCR